MNPWELQIRDRMVFDDQEQCDMVKEQGIVRRHVYHYHKARMVLVCSPQYRPALLTASSMSLVSEMSPIKILAAVRSKPVTKRSGHQLEHSHQE